MAVEKQYSSDVDAILSHRHDNGADLWATPDKRLIKGSPFSTLESVLLLLELGMEPCDPLLKEAADLIFSTWQKDGRFKVYPQGSIYPCHTIHAADALCHLGYASDERLQKTFRHLLDTQYADGGWRCNKFSYGRGPETEYSNPFPTLTALSAFRFSDYLNREPALDRAVDFLLEHWIIRKPIGPCHYGIGTLFLQIEYPFHNYNLFVYLHVLSFYDRAKKDERFLDALNVFESKTADGKVVVERVNRRLAGLSFCKQGKFSTLATIRYQEILKNLGRGTENEIIFRNTGISRKEIGEKHMTIQLKPFTDNDMPLFLQWLDREHIKPWYSPVEAWIEEVNSRTTEYSWIRHFIIYADETPIGFCQYYPYWKGGETWNGDIPAEETYSVDYLIGNPDYLRKGYASEALKLLNSIILTNVDAKRVIVQPETDNVASRKTLLSAGYSYDAKNDLFLLER